jgi:hypothetical protein
MLTARRKRTVADDHYVPIKDGIIERAIAAMHARDRTQRDPIKDARSQAHWREFRRARGMALPKARKESGP